MILFVVYQVGYHTYSVVKSELRYIKKNRVKLDKSAHPHKLIVPSILCFHVLLPRERACAN